jgi:hypothetical protein
MARHDVIGAAEEGDEIRAHGERAVELLLAYRSRAAAADREVGVEQRALCPRDVPCQAIGPAVVATVAVRVVDAFGGAVADGDVAFVVRQRHGRSS